MFGLGRYCRPHLMYFRVLNSNTKIHYQSQLQNNCMILLKISLKLTQVLRLSFLSGDLQMAVAFPPLFFSQISLHFPLFRRGRECKRGRQRPFASLMPQFFFISRQHCLPLKHASSRGHKSVSARL